jgi:hypothetical protein
MSNRERDGPGAVNSLAAPGQIGDESSQTDSCHTGRVLPCYLKYPFTTLWASRGMPFEEENTRP